MNQPIQPSEPSRKETNLPAIDVPAKAAQLARTEDVIESTAVLYSDKTTGKSSLTDPLFEHQPLAAPQEADKRQISAHRAFTLFDVISCLVAAPLQSETVAMGADMAILRGVSARLGQYENKIQELQGTINRINAEIKNLAPTDSAFGWIESIGMDIAGVVMGGLFGGPVGAIAAVVLATANEVMSHVTIDKKVKNAQGKVVDQKVNLWNAWLGDKSELDQFFIKMALGLSAGLISGLGVGLAAAASETADLAAEEAAYQAEQEAYQEAQQVAEQARAADPDAEIEEPEAPARPTYEDKSVWWVDNKIKRSIFVALSQFENVTGSAKTDIADDKLTEDLGMWGNLVKGAGASGEVAKWVGVGVSVVAQIATVVIGGKYMGTVPFSSGSIVEKAMQGVQYMQLAMDGILSEWQARISFTESEYLKKLASAQLELTDVQKNVNLESLTRTMAQAMLKSTMTQNKSMMDEVFAILESVEASIRPSLRG